MASIHRVKRSSKWHCSFFDFIYSKWRLRSTGTSDKNEAEAVCLRFESLSRQAASVTEGKVPAECSGELLEAALSIVQIARRGELSEATGRAFGNRILRATRQDEIDAGTARGFLENWLSGRKLSRAFKTGEKYQTTVSLFLKSLGKRAESPLASITVRDIERFRDARSKEVSPVTTRGDIKILSAAFTVARKTRQFFTRTRAKPLTYREETARRGTHSGPAMSLYFLPQRIPKNGKQPSCLAFMRV